MKWWLFSWVITRDGTCHFTKATLPALAAHCLNPPQPPYAIAIADSGQKHQLYLAPMNRTREHVGLVLECERIDYRPADLAARLNLAKCLAAAAGKPTLSEPPAFRLYESVMDYWSDGERLADAWATVYGTPLSRLAAFLTPNRETCQHEHPSDLAPPNPTPAANVRRSRVPAADCGPDGPGLFA